MSSSSAVTPWVHRASETFSAPSRVSSAAGTRPASAASTSHHLVPSSVSRPQSAFSFSDSRRSSSPPLKQSAEEEREQRGSKGFRPGSATKSSPSRRFEGDSLLALEELVSKSRFTPSIEDMKSILNGAEPSEKARETSSMSIEKEGIEADSTTEVQSGSIVGPQGQEPLDEKSYIEDVSAEVGGGVLRSPVQLLHVERNANAKLKEARDRLDVFVNDLFQHRLKEYPSLTAFAKTITLAYDHFVGVLSRHNSLSTAAQLRGGMARAAQELAEANKLLKTKDAENNDLKEIVAELEKANDRHMQDRDALEKYIDELRTSVAAHTNRLLPGIEPSHGLPVSGRGRSLTPSTAVLQPPPGPSDVSFTSNATTDAASANAALLPDDPQARPYTLAVRRMAMEIENLRSENKRLSEIGIQQAEAFTEQSEEMQMVLDRANEFQQQTGRLKATVRVMRRYIAELEGRVEELTPTYAERSTMAFDRFSVESRQRLQWFDSQYIDGAISSQLCLFKGITYIEPQFFSTGPPTELGAILPLSPLTVKSTAVLRKLTSDVPEATADSLLSKAKIKVYSLDELSTTLNDLFNNLLSFAAAQQQSQEGMERNLLKVLGTNDNDIDIASEAINRTTTVTFGSFEDWLAKYLKSKYSHGRTSLDVAAGLEVFSERYQRRSTEAFLFRTVNHHLLPIDFISSHLPAKLNELREWLRKEEGTSKKNKDRIQRTAFLAAVEKVFGKLPGSAKRALALATTVAQDSKSSEEVSYEAFFEKSSPGAAVVYDFLVRLLARQVAYFHDALAQELYTRGKRYFEAQQQALFDEFSTATLGPATDTTTTPAAKETKKASPAAKRRAVKKTGFGPRSNSPSSNAVQEEGDGLTVPVPHSTGVTPLLQKTDIQLVQEEQSESGDSAHGLYEAAAYMHLAAAAESKVPTTGAGLSKAASLALSSVGAGAFPAPAGSVFKIDKVSKTGTKAGTTVLGGTVERMIHVTSIDDDGVGWITALDVAESILEIDPQVTVKELRRRLGKLTRSHRVFCEAIDIPDSICQLEATGTANTSTAPSEKDLFFDSVASIQNLNLTALERYWIPIEAVLDNMRRLCSFGKSLPPPPPTPADPSQ